MSVMSIERNFISIFPFYYCLVVKIFIKQVRKKQNQIIRKKQTKQLDYYENRSCRVNVMNILNYVAELTERNIVQNYILHTNVSKWSGTVDIFRNIKSHVLFKSIYR